mmetsp:Transcript_558/g.1670  ORF Transcript_558/g.1670 Transcript_558/m.1670 type:complete len:201 (+) Transcript_558:63-665(+)
MGPVKAHGCSIPLCSLRPAMRSWTAAGSISTGPLQRMEAQLRASSSSESNKLASSASTKSRAASARKAQSTWICCMPNLANVSSRIYSKSALKAIFKMPTMAPFLLKGIGAKTWSFFATILSISSSMESLCRLEGRRSEGRPRLGSPRMRASWASKAWTSFKITVSMRTEGFLGSRTVIQFLFWMEFRKKLAIRWPATIT